VPETVPAVAARRARPLVLHVDDNEANRYAVSRVLTHAGFDVIEGKNGREALEKARDNPDIVVLDVRLPDLSGVEVCKAIKSDPATAAVLVLHLSASYTTSDHIAEGLDAGADGYLVRPVEPVELVATVNALLRQRRMEDALRASEERYRLLVENVHDYAIVTVSTEGTITSWNYGAEMATGFAEHEQVGRPVHELFEVSAAPGISDAIAAAAVMGRAASEQWLVRRDGCRRLVTGAITAMRDGPGRLVGFSFVLRDVTTERQAAEALAASEARFRLMADSAPVLIWMSDAAGAAIWFNRPWLAFVGRDLAHEQGAGWLENVHPDDYPVVHTTRQTHVAARSPLSMEYRLRRQDGEYRYVLDRGVPILDEATGAFTGFIGTCTDITDRRLAEATLAESEAKFRQLAESMPQLAWIARPDGYIFWYNQRWYEFTGTDPASMEGWGWQSVHDPAELPRVLDRWRSSIASGSPFEMEFPLRAADGRFRWFLTRVAPLRDAFGNVALWFGTNTDIEERRQLADERTRLLERERTARADAEQANRLKDEFLATLSHELRTPLNAIVGWAMILRRTRDVEHHVADGLATIERNAKVQAQLIDDLLDVSRIISGKLRLEIEAVDLTSIIESAIASVHPAAEAKEITFNQVLSSRQTTVNGDAARLQQVVWNLLTNAVKFTPRGGGVTVTLGRIDSYVEIVVADTGKGIEPEFLPHVFDRFRQGDPSTTRAHGGLGLGLAIVRHLTELHGGSVRAESDGASQGARFTVRLPVTAAQRRMGRRASLDRDAADRDARDREAHSAATAPHERQPGLDGVRVLVVDDQEDSRRLLSHILGDSAANVETAASAEEAMELLRRGRFDVIVSDVGMPEHDGYELMRWVRALPDESGGRTPALALTAFARSEDRRHALLAGFQNHLAKPVDPFELLAAVASAAGRTGRSAVDRSSPSE
jgi:PAS domain S-box-containing protein